MNATEMLATMNPHARKYKLNPQIPHSLPYPTRNVKVTRGYIEEYIIPEEKKAEVLEMLYPLTDTPNLDAMMYDVCAQKQFRVRTFKVIQGPERPYLMSPYWEKSGGSVIDWAEIKLVLP